MNDPAATITIVLLVINLIGLLMVGNRIKSQSDESRGFDRRIGKLEAQLETLPTHKDLRELRKEFESIAEDVASIDGRTETMTQLLRTIQQHLLDRERNT